MDNTTGHNDPPPKLRSSSRVCRYGTGMGARLAQLPTSSLSIPRPLVHLSVKNRHVAQLLVMPSPYAEIFV
jgi:hypothetical protein